MPEARRKEFVDLYELLEISPRASQEVVQAAYRVLVRNFHPDLNASTAAELRIRELNAAYTILSDPEGRARYDLECIRVRRKERLAQAGQNGLYATGSGSGGSHVYSLRRASPMDSAGQRLPALSVTGPALLGLFLVAAMATFLLIILWASFDPVTEPTPAFGGSPIEWSGH